MSARDLQTFQDVTEICKPSPLSYVLPPATLPSYGGGGLDKSGVCGRVLGKLVGLANRVLSCVTSSESMSEISSNLLLVLNILLRPMTEL